MSTVSSLNPFEIFFQDSVYLELKNHLYSYLRRKDEIRKFLAGTGDGILLELGSGISPVTEVGPKTVFTDISWQALEFLRVKENIKRVAAMDAVRMAIGTGRISTVVCSEVLEHIPDDQSALEEIARILKPGGVLILTVPLHAYLYAFDDRFVSHERRYRMRNLAESLRRLGFTGFRFSKVMGLFDKAAALTAILIFWAMAPLMKSREKKANRHVILKWILPFYKALNRIYCFLVKWEAKIFPLALTNVILISCRKAGLAE
ncbi:MAG TPA: class I SAM-dependent methyltransferase [Candidatus Omnitrophota bacterium]|nr:class I SAM-dependent methyltransferase [Candidatus Omnitrophota bacterium]